MYRLQWPLVAVLLVFTIVTIEVQMVANDVYPGVRRLVALNLFLLMC